jgi:hypothetical protein
MQGYYLCDNYIKNLENSSFQKRIVDCVEICAFHGLSIVLDDLNRGYIIKDGEILDLISNEYRVSALSYPHIGFYKRGSIRSYGIYNINSDDILFETSNWIGRDILGEFVFSEYLNEINCRHVEFSTPKWTFDLSQLPLVFKENKEEPSKVEQFIGVYNQKLWVQLNGYRLLSLDMKTGKQLHLVPNFRKGAGFNFLDSDKGVVKMLAGHWYLEFDLKMLEYTVEKKIDPDEVFHVHKSQYYKDNPKIYFCGRHDTLQFPNCFGIFNTETYQVEWFKTSENNELYFNPPQSNGARLCVLDSENTLRIFEKEELT